MFGIQLLVLTLLAVIVFVTQVVALVDALGRPANAFTSEGKLTKQIWLIILAAATVIGFLGLPPMRATSSSFLNVLAVVPAVIYWVDVRPRVKPYGRGSGGGRSTPGGW